MSFFGFGKKNNGFQELGDSSANRGQPRMSVVAADSMDAEEAARKAKMNTLEGVRQSEAARQKQLTLEGRAQLDRQRAYDAQQDPDFNAQVAKENAAKAAASKSNLVVGDLLGLGSGGRSRRRRAHRARRSRKAMRAGTRRARRARRASRR
jgi:hypothetical protein